MFFWAFTLFVLASPLYKGGNRAWPLMLLELGAIGFLLALALRGWRAADLRLPRSLLIAIAILMSYPILQLVPLPGAVWQALPGHEEYQKVLREFATPGAEDAPRPISVVPSATEYGWLALLPPLASLLAVQALVPAQIVRLLAAMAVLAGVEGLLGLLQVGAGGDAIFRARETQALGVATGTFVNQAHLATMLGMMLPMLAGLIAYDMRRLRHGAPRTESVPRRVVVLASSVLILVCLVFTHSRAGVASALAGLALSSVLLVGRRGERINIAVGAIMVGGLVLASLIGLAPLLERFEPATLLATGAHRAALYAATLRAGIEFLPFGSGLSTFASVFPRFQGTVFGGYIDYAHNDYLQLFMETGLAGVAVLALFAATYVVRMADLVRRRRGRSFTVLQLAAGIALVPAILHAMFDFGLHMPAIAVWFATLAGVMLHPGTRDIAEAP